MTTQEKNKLVISGKDFNLILAFMPEYNKPCDNGYMTIDWNILMPVVCKICHEIDCSSEQYKYIATALKVVDLKNLYGAVFQFIQWYNKNNNHEYDTK